MKVYLDNSATTSAYPQVVDAVVDALSVNFGNPSSMHSMGVEAERRVKQARRSVAKLLGASEKDVFFTSGGTEGNNLAILGVAEAFKKQGNHFITTKVEHPSVLNAYKTLEENGAEVTYLSVNEMGHIDAEEAIRAIRPDTVLISVMHVNNESGAIQPVQAIGKALKKMKTRPLFHIDGIQAAGKIKVSVKRLGADFYTISGHKIHAPKGIGALFIREGVHIRARQFGGAQEKGLRPGTENMPGIIGLGVAADIQNKEIEGNISRMIDLKQMLWEDLSKELKEIKCNSGFDDGSVSHILNISFLGMRGEVLLHELESKGIFVSTGSACSSKNKNYSHVLKAMGLTENAMEGAIRFSLCASLTDEEIRYAIKEIVESVRRLSKIIKGR